MTNISVTLCYTQTLDGRLATATGESQWIGGTESVAYWHQLRAEHAALMVGVGTVLRDNPRLTVRHVQGRNPLRIVVDSALRTPLDAAVLAGEAAPGTLLAVTKRASVERIAAVRARGAEVVVLADAGGQVDLLLLFKMLAARGLFSVMVEGGAQLITALLRARLANRAVVCVAPKIMGAGIEAIGDLNTRQLDAMFALTNVQLLRYGDDYVFDGQLAYSE